jgi:hypothetical protein
MVLVTDVYEFEQIIGEYVSTLCVVEYPKIFCRGSFSSVVLATHNETKNKYAIKVQSIVPTP